jgi:hypothetical protein
VAAGGDGAQLGHRVLAFTKLVKIMVTIDVLPTG